MKPETLQCEKLMCFVENIHRYPGESRCETLMFVDKSDYEYYCKRCTGNTTVNKEVLAE